MPRKNNPERDHALAIHRELDLELRRVIASDDLRDERAAMRTPQGAPPPPPTTPPVAAAKGTSP